MEPNEPIEEFKILITCERETRVWCKRSGCNKYYKDKTSLSKHVHAVHSGINLSCPNCLGFYSTRYNLKRHRLRCDAIVNSKIKQEYQKYLDDNSKLKKSQFSEKIFNKRTYIQNKAHSIFEMDKENKNPKEEEKVEHTDFETEKLILSFLL